MATKKTATPASTEKEVLIKTTGQTESEKDPPIDIQQIADKISVAELVQLSMRNAEQISSVKIDLDKLYVHDSDLKGRRFGN